LHRLRRKLLSDEKCRKVDVKYIENALAKTEDSVRVSVYLIFAPFNITDADRYVPSEFEEQDPLFLLNTYRMFVDNQSIFTSFGHTIQLIASFLLSIFILVNFLYCVI